MYILSPERLGDNDINREDGREIYIHSHRPKTDCLTGRVSRHDSPDITYINLH